MALTHAQSYLQSLPAGVRRNARLFRWFAALDNYIPAREHTNGHAVTFFQPDRVTIGVALIGIGKITLPAESVYVVIWPDGTTVAMRPVAWHGTDEEYGPRVTLHPYPADPTISFGPKRSYLIRLSEI